VPHLSPTTLTTDEQRLILRATAGNLRDHTIISLALGTGLRLAEIVGLNVGDVFASDGTPRFACAYGRRSPRAAGRQTCSYRIGSLRS
jgi:integrase